MKIETIDYEAGIAFYENVRKRGNMICKLCGRNRNGQLPICYCENISGAPRDVLIDMIAAQKERITYLRGEITLQGEMCELRKQWQDYDSKIKYLEKVLASCPE